MLHYRPALQNTNLHISQRDSLKSSAVRVLESAIIRRTLFDQADIAGHTKHCAVSCPGCIYVYTILKSFFEQVPDFDSGCYIGRKLAQKVTQFALKAAKTN